MSKRVFVVDDPTVAAEVETLLRSRGLNRTSQRNADLPSMNEVAQRGMDVMDDDMIEEADFPFFKRVGNHRSVSSSPFPWRDGDVTPKSEYRSMGPGMRGVERIPQMKRPSMDEFVKKTFNNIMSKPSRRPFESSCGTFNPKPSPSRLFVNGACGGFIPADARDLAMGRQLYTHSGCGGFEPVSQRPMGGCGGWSAPSFGGCGGWSTPSYGGCGGTTYMSGC